MSLLAFDKLSASLRQAPGKQHYIWTMRELTAIARGIAIVCWPRDRYVAHLFSVLAMSPLLARKAYWGCGNMSSSACLGIVSSLQKNAR